MLLCFLSHPKKPPGLFVAPGLNNLILSQVPASLGLAQLKFFVPWCLCGLRMDSHEGTRIQGDYDHGAGVRLCPPSMAGKHERTLAL